MSVSPPGVGPRAGAAPAARAQYKRGLGLAGRDGRDVRRARLRRSCLKRVHAQREQLIAKLRRDRVGPRAALAAMVADVAQGECSTPTPAPRAEPEAGGAAGSAGGDAISSGGVGGAGDAAGGRGDAFEWWGDADMGGDVAEAHAPADELDDLLAEMEEVLLANLREEERAALLEYEHGVAVDKAALHDAARFSDSLAAAGSTAVLCPVCLHAFLSERGGLIFCDCGFHVDGSTYGMSLDDVRQLLEGAYAEHAGQCQATPEFVNHEAGGTSVAMLHLRCAACGADAPVL